VWDPHHRRCPSTRRRKRPRQPALSTPLRPRVPANESCPHVPPRSIVPVAPTRTRKLANAPLLPYVTPNIGTHEYYRLRHPRLPYRRPTQRLRPEEALCRVREPPLVGQ